MCAKSPLRPKAASTVITEPEIFLVHFKSEARTPCNSLFVSNFDPADGTVIVPRDFPPNLMSRCREKLLPLTLR